jgi:hypothetical protein
MGLEPEPSDTERDETVELLQVGAEIAGGLTATAIGLFVAGPPGAVAGAFASPVATRLFARIGSELQRRFLSHREEVRVGATLAYAALRTQERLDAGELLREDGFFDGDGGRSAAEEVLEGGLLAAQREHEERKLPWVSYLLANLNFAVELDRARANLVIKYAERMSYRQVQLLAFTARLDELAIAPLPQNAEAIGSTMGKLPDDMMQEIMELSEMGLLDSTTLTYGMTRYNPRLGTLPALGLQLYELMGLARMPVVELDDIVKHYSARGAA